MRASLIRLSCLLSLLIAPATPDDAVAPVNAFFNVVDQLAAIVATDGDGPVCTDSFGQPLNQRQMMLLGQTFRGAGDSKFVDEKIDGDRATVRALVSYRGGSLQWRTFELRRSGEAWRVFSISQPPRESVPLAEAQGIGPEVAESEPVRALEQFLSLLKTTEKLIMPSHEGVDVVLLWAFIHGRQCGAWKSVETGRASEWKDFASAGSQVLVTLRGGTQKTARWRFVVGANEFNAGKLAIDYLNTEPLP